MREGIGMMIYRRTITILCLLFSLAVLLNGCAGLSILPSSGMANLVYPEGQEDEIVKSWPDEKLTKAFRKYWFLRFDGQIERIFKMEAPYIQEMLPYEKYAHYMKGARNNRLVEIEPLGIEKKTDELYEVKFYQRFIAPNGKEKEIYLTEEWVEAGGKWYHLFQDASHVPQNQKREVINGRKCRTQCGIAPKGLNIPDRGKAPVSVSSV